MARSGVTLSQIEAVWATKRDGLQFSPEIEALYQSRMESYRSSFMTKGTLPLLVAYNIFLIVDVMLAPQTLALSAFVHLALVTPAIAIIGRLYPLAKSQWLRDLATVATPFLIVAQIMFIYTLNDTDASNHYQYLAIMVVIYMNNNRRVGLRLAVMSTLAIIALYLAVLLAGHSNFESKFIGTAMMLTSAYVTLVSVRLMEREARFAFLGRLREQVLREDAEKQSMADALTGLPNRRSLREQVDRLWLSREPDLSPVAVVMIDIDRFKPFNDHYGHVAGDECLRRVAEAIASQLRSDQDFAARYGGEEFILLLPATGLEAAITVARRVRRKIEALAIPNKDSAETGFVTASLGVASGDMGAFSFKDIVSAADQALYTAKQAGRNRVWPPFADEPALDEAERRAGSAQPAA